jgi:hypothetical protein
LLRLDTVIGLLVAVPAFVVVPVTHEAVYPVIGDPPLALGGVKAMLALALPAVAAPILGAPGTVVGVTETALDAILLPALLLALTVQLCAEPLIRPDTVIGLFLLVPVFVVVPETHEAV